MKKSRLYTVTAKGKILSKLTNLNSESEHILTTRLQLASICFSIFVALSQLTGNAHASQILFNAGGILNGQAVDAAVVETAPIPTTLWLFGSGLIT